MNLKTFFKISNNYGKNIRNLSRFKRRLILISIDIFSIIISLLFSLSFFENYNIFLLENLFFLISLITFIGIIIYLKNGQYNGISRYGSQTLIEKFLFNNLILSFGLFITSNFINVNYISLNILLLFTIILTFLNSLVRSIIRKIIQKNVNFTEKYNSKNIVIYGAGNAGAQLAASLIISNKYNLKGFIDDNPDLEGRKIYEIPIFSTKYLFEEVNNIDQIFLAIPSLTKKQRLILINKISELSIPTLQVPSIDELARGSVSISDLRPLSIEDLIGREKMNPLKNIFGKSIKNNVIFVSGAAGSIGEEICIQLLELNPIEIILFDISEASLYMSIEKLKSLNINNLSLTPILGCATNYRLLKNIFKEKKVNIVFHAAAYKHVPLVEINPIEGIRNNVFSTEAICRASEETNSVKKVILISSDKAVRPTNIMGASKRVSELIIQGFAEEFNFKKPHKVFSMVRFGNVIGSSGSVIPLFKKQIKEGGPITITHKDVFRFFMTIEEAAQLVIQATEIAEGNEVFLLDMGDQVKITDIAKQLLKINGLSLKDNNNPNGDIEIKYIGLRPGEKLKEELLINSKATKTIHPLIYSARESSIPLKELSYKLNHLKISCKEQNISAVLEILKEIVPEWHN